MARTDSKSSKLAASLIDAVGLVCLRICTLAGHNGYSRVTGGGIADRDRAGLRLWFRSARSASKVVDELLRKHGTRRGADVVIETNPDETNRLLRASADLIGVSVSDDDVIDALTASLTKRAADQIKKMPRSQRTMKALRGVVDRDVSGLLERQAFI